MPRRIFIAGDRGQLAQELARTYASRCDVAWRAGRASADIADRDAVAAAIGAFRPDIVINAAAYTAVDKAEDEAERAFAINRDGARHVAEAAKTAGALLVHISTDYVFDGGKPSPYVETDPTGPLGVYGRSKLEGERAVTDTAGDYVILRTSWLYGAQGANFVKTILQRAGRGEAIDVVDDQWGAPTSTADLADAIAHAGDSFLSAENRAALCGIYNVTAQGETTWCGFARAIMEISAARGGPSCAVRPVATGQYPARARRPANSRLDGSKFARMFGIRLPAWRNGLERCLDQLIVARRGASA